MAGTAAISVGVMHHGQIIYKNSFGYRDMQKRLAPDSDTVYPIASITKAMIAALFADLVDRKVVSFETKLRDLVPEYRVPYKELKLKELSTEANIIDLLAHRLGITMANNLWSQKSQLVLARKADTAKIIGSLEPIQPFRNSFVYQNWAYASIRALCHFFWYKLTLGCPVTDLQVRYLSGSQGVTWSHLRPRLCLRRSAWLTQPCPRLAATTLPSAT